MVVLVAVDDDPVKEDKPDDESIPRMPDSIEERLEMLEVFVVSSAALFSPRSDPVSGSYYCWRQES